MAGGKRGGEKGSWTRSGQLSGIVWRCLCNNTLSDLIWHITADISGLAAYHPTSPSTLSIPLSCSTWLLNLWLKQISNITERRTTWRMRQKATLLIPSQPYPLSFFCHSLCLPSAKKCHFLWAIICFATLCERSYPIWPSTPFFLLLLFALFSFSLYLHPLRQVVAFVILCFWQIWV